VRWLEGECYPLIKSLGVKPALKMLAHKGMLRDSGDTARAPDRPTGMSTGMSTGDYDGWKSNECLRIVQAVMRCRSDLECRRRVSAFVCSSSFIGDEDSLASYADVAADAGANADADADAGADAGADANPRGWRGAVVASGDEGERGEGSQGNEEDAFELAQDNLTAFLSGFDLRATLDPEQALRKLLLEFPFLPIDAGEGADRVLKTVAVIYLVQHPEQARHLRENLQARGAAAQHRDAESVVYILIYAIIMLNTDLHNPKIKTKMTVREFVRSTTSTVLADVFSTTELHRMYYSIKRAPLRICSPSIDQSKLRHLHLPANAGSSKYAVDQIAGGHSGLRGRLVVEWASKGWAYLRGHAQEKGRRWGWGKHLWALVSGLTLVLMVVAVRWAMAPLRRAVSVVEGGAGEWQALAQWGISSGGSP